MNSDKRTIADLMQDAKSCNGYARQAAVEALVARRCAEAVPILLIRANDWVDQVRAAAQRGLDAFLSDEHIDAWRQSLDALLALRRWTRLGNTDLLERIDAFLCRKSNFEYLTANQHLCTASSRRYLFSLNLRAATSEADRFQLLYGALAGTDILIARDAARQIQLEGNSPQLAKLAEFACRSKFSDVRLAGLRIILRLGSSSGVEIIRSLCNDRNARVRDVALSANSSEREALLEAARQDFLMGTLVMRRTIAVHTLFALGASDAATLAESAVRDQSVKVRHAALESLIALAQPEQRDRLVLASLRDPSRRVRRLGERAIGKGANSPPLPTLIEIFLANPGAMTSLTKAAARLPLWVRLQFLLAMLESRTLGYDSAQTLIDELTSWLKDSTRNYATPAPDQARSLADSWSKVYPVIPLSLAREIADVLNVYRVNR